MGTPIFILDDDCLDLILDFAAPASRELIDIDRKSSMSVESFATEFVPTDNTVIETFVNIVSLSCFENLISITNKHRVKCVEDSRSWSSVASLHASRFGFLKRISMN